MTSKEREQERVRKALEAVEGQVEIVYRIQVCPSYVKIIGEIGGDAVSYKVFDDGTVGV